MLGHYRKGDKEAQISVSDRATGVTVLTAMITPAVLISACGTLIFSTSNRVARIVDRVRQLSLEVEQLFSGNRIEFQEERREELDRQLSFYTVRGRLIQRSLTSFYLALGMFVASTIALGAMAFLPGVDWLPSALGITGAITLFYGCVLLIGEARLAIQAVTHETQFAVRLSELYRRKREGK
jgi:hypothetical protein